MMIELSPNAAEFVQLVANNYYVPEQSFNTDTHEITFALSVLVTVKDTLYSVDHISIISELRDLGLVREISAMRMDQNYAEEVFGLGSSRRIASTTPSSDVEMTIYCGDAFMKLLKTFGEFEAL